MVWEILEGLSKSKIEIEWSDIMAIRAVAADTDEPGILEIKVNPFGSSYYMIHNH